MAYALTAWKAYPVPIDQGTIKRFEHVMEYHITGLAVNVDCDIGDLTGNFWTQAVADATYGTIATAALAYLKSLYPKASCVTYDCAELQGAFIKVAVPAAANEFAAAINATTKFPEILFNAGDGPLALTFRFNVSLKTGEWPLTDVKYGTGI